MAVPFNSPTPFNKPPDPPMQGPPPPRSPAPPPRLHFPSRSHQMRSATRHDADASVGTLPQLNTMRPIFFCSTLVLLFVARPRSCQGGNILVVPIEGSHWINMKILLQALHARGHNITIVRSSKSWYISENSTYYKTVTVPVERSLDQRFITRIVSEIIQFERGALPLTSFLHITFGMTSTTIDAHSAIGEFIAATLDDQELMRTLKENKYDLQIMLDADIWLMRVDFVFEYPRPTMPNVVYMGGFQCKPAEPLPEHLEEFVQSSGEHGVIIMSLGTFGTDQQQLGNNTLLVDWMPQNDLFGHPKTKLFVAHGGTNGVQEAMYHGVPVVGLPVFFDQYDNLLRLKERGGAEILTLRTVDKDDNFLAAVKRVLNDPSYRMNMQRLSRLHRDAPMKPMDSALFWIEFVMRHKGAAHLRTESYRLPWYSYHSVDVMLFLAGITLLIVMTFAALARCLCSRCVTWKRILLDDSTCDGSD
ncbi:UDP-glucuronosyltransferase 2A1 [Takifugu flavidus]|uniref:UDP-glucuronosyltransferase 2A1 n=1 Tax=Takifugu flavidus TaxID=433684 RepID=A0A5C6MIL0_9TELE|nr:UDP-glucuronosyltransferase 2A1 [Takifugu flavidus]